MINTLFSNRNGWGFPAPNSPLDSIAWCVVDTETTGLEVKKARVISLGAVDMSAQGIPLGKRFEAVLNIDVELSNQNVLIHRLTPGHLRKGKALESTYQKFLDYLTGKPLLAFHAAFDKAMLEKEFRTVLKKNCRLPFSDIAFWTSALFPEHHGLRTLDEWMGAFRLQITHRHQAVLDALVTAEIALICLHRAKQLGLYTWGDLDNRIRNYARLQKLNLPH